ncbi:carboxylesterase family protein [Marinobacter lacisalsi]|uniref:Carboxylic ester hydrolase n=1 Tax=Marinobacter lacisalsi TaxID=475979 RepID=A0ABV8QQH0_9GAMM
MKNRQNRKTWRTVMMLAAVSPAALLLSGCGDDDDSRSSDDTRTGTFVDSPVAGLDYTGSDSSAGRTNERGEFRYREGETITFAIGDLELGAAEGAEVVTPLSISDGADTVDDPAVTNRLILLQSLDADGDLNNGIQISDGIRDQVSAEAMTINFNQAPEDFRGSLDTVLTALEESGAFTDLDPRPRQAREAADAKQHFERSRSAGMTVATTGGDLQGFEANEDTWQFLGVPYGKPPVGDLRWRPPEPAEPWDGVRMAVSWADQSAQNPTLESANEGGMSEDSLYLNITTPKDADDLPVMVWFHGGSFSILSANSRQYNNPDSLTTKGVVLVTVNHRLGPFGYIAHPLLTEESGYNGSGNYGQMDLVLALQWVQDNIEAFGGDPDNVTLFGQSGGGGKAYSLMNSPQATGLFHKAIVQSGFAPLDPESAPEDSLAASEAVGTALFERLGVSTLEEARALSWTEITQADLDNNIPRQTYRPNVDFHYQTNTYYQNVQDGMPSDVPLMAGATNGDYDTLRAALPVWLDQRSPGYQSEQFVYVFSRVPDGWDALGLNSCHGCELPYVFNYPAGMVQNYLFNLVQTPEGETPAIGDLNGNGVSGTEGDTADIFTSMQYGADDLAITDLTMTFWTNFAKSGDPGTGSLNWPAYTTTNDTFMHIGPESGAAADMGLEGALE